VNTQVTQVSPWGWPSLYKVLRDWGFVRVEASRRQQTRGRPAIGGSLDASLSPDVGLERFVAANSHGCSRSIVSIAVAIFANDFSAWLLASA
jgi:hypothetical protein